MKYIHVVNYVRSSLWAILPEKMDEILAVLAFRASGGTFTDEEIRARVGDGSGGSAPSQAGVTAIIPLRGTITHRAGSMSESSGGASAERFAKMTQAAAADPNIAAIVIDTDSPGGTVNGVPEAADAVFQARQQKPVIAMANGMMASAAYWISAQAHEIVAAPGVVDASIGSIGVYTVHADLSAALEKEGIKPTIISAGKYKVAGNPWAPLDAEEQAVMQARVDTTYESFLSAVARGRGVEVSAVRNGYGEGRALSAVDAKRARMVDRIATMDATLARLASPQIRGRIMAGARAEVLDGMAFAVDEIAMMQADGCAPAELMAQEPDGDADRLRRFRLS